MINFNQTLNKQTLNTNLELNINITSISSLEMAKDLELMHKIDMVTIIKKSLLEEAKIEIERELDGLSKNN